MKAPGVQYAGFGTRTEARNISRSFSYFFLFLFFALSSAWGVDPSRHISQYAHTAWRLQGDFFGGPPSAITQTTDGYLWIGTQAGLLRFDGVRFVQWISPDETQLPSSTITSLLGARDGSLWIGTESGLSHWQNQHLINYPSVQRPILSILEDHDGTVWIIRQVGRDGSGLICHITGLKTQCFGKADGVPDLAPTALIQDSLGNFWIGGNAALVRWTPGSSNTYSPRGLKAGMGGVYALAAEPDGSLWVGMAVPGQPLGLQRFVNGALEPFVTPELDGRNLEVESLFLDPENTLWVGTYKQGLYRIRGHTVDHFMSTDGLSGNTVSNIFGDREGNVWIATTNGLDNFRDLPVTTFSTREGLSTEEVDSVLASRNGTVWVGGAEALDALRQGKGSFIQSGKRLRENQVTSLFEDHAGRLWVGIDNTLTIYSKGKFRRIDKPNGRPVGVIVGITEDVDYNIWAETIGPPRNLIRIQDLKVRQEFPAPQMPAAREVAADPSGGIWLGLINGDLAHYRDGTTEVISFNYRQDSDVRQLIVNSDGSVLGATAFGLIGWKQGKKQTLTVRNGLPCDSVLGLISDDAGALWLYTQCGLVAIPNTELQKWWEQPDIGLQLKTLDLLDGVQPGRAPFQVSAKTPDGRLWFANGAVLQMIDPAHLHTNHLAPPVHIERVVADRKSYPPIEGLRLPPHARDFEIDYTGLSFEVPQKVRFRYKLDGRDAGWQEPGTRRQAFYSDLPPGAYRFRVVACNNDGVWNDEGATLSFTVAPAWYQTNWFRVLCVVGGVAIAWAFYRIRVRQIARAINARFDERLAERTRLARDLHDTFLQTIQGSKLVADDALDPSTDPARMRHAMETLSGWLEQAMREGRAALNSLRESATQRNDLAEAFRRATADEITPGSTASAFSVVGESREMHPLVRDEVYRIGYEAIRNAYKHSQATQLEVELRYARDLTVCVRDNGIGIEPAVVRQGKEGHFGLSGMRERAARIGGELTLVSSPGSGTELVIVVPGRIVFRNVSSTPFEKAKAIFRRILHKSNPN